MKERKRGLKEKNEGEEEGNEGEEEGNEVRVLRSHVKEGRLLRLITFHIFL